MAALIHPYAKIDPSVPLTLPLTQSPSIGGFAGVRIVRRPTRSLVNESNELPETRLQPLSAHSSQVGSSFPRSKSDRFPNWPRTSTFVLTCWSKGQSLVIPFR